MRNARAGRPVRTRPAYEMQKQMGAVFGLNYGWEHPLWFAANGEPTEETYGFTRQNWWAPVGREVRMLREKAGIIDISNFAKYSAKGPGAEAWLNALFANRMPRAIGRSCLTPLIGKRGGIAGDFTVTKLGEDEFLIVGSGMAERFHQRFFKAMPLPAGTSFESRTEALCGFNVAGPMARDLLARLTNADLSNAAFPFMRSQRITVAGVECVAIRVSFTGDLGWELHCAEADQVALYAALLEAGSALGAGPGGQPGAGVVAGGKGLWILGPRLQPGILAAGKRAGRADQAGQGFPEQGRLGKDRRTTRRARSW